ncbi:MAG: peptidase M14 [Planctomycetes bacterium]|nr:peptidase M14 [Planctomycetota bacterium]
MIPPKPRAAVLWLLLGSAALAQAPLTRAEQTDFRETSRHADVIAFLEAVVAGQDRMELSSLGRTGEEREIPLVIVAPPGLRDPARAHAAGRMVVYVQANIHAGEVDGKEAVLMWLREAAGGAHDALLAHLVLLVVPNFNADGNEPISTRNRPHQDGPEGGVGQRANAGNLDLNRDAMKAEAPETRAALALGARWDPDLFLDLHTTNGSKHRYALTFSSSVHPNADRTVQDFADRVLLPEVFAALRPRYDTFYYGDFLDDRDPEKGWGTFAWEGRYATNYWGLRNRFSVLLESYAYCDFRTRIDVTRRALSAVLAAAAKHRDRMRALVAAADERLAAGEWKEMGVAFERTAWAGTWTVAGFEVTEESLGRRRPVAEDRPRDYECRLFLRFEPTASVPVPAGYLFGRGLGAVAEHLRRHGIRVYRLAHDGELEVEACRLEKLHRQERLYQGRTLQHAEVAVNREVRTFRAGDHWVPLSQPLGRLAAELLEPRGRDGLLAWGFLDALLFEQWRGTPKEIPIYRTPAAVALPLWRR